MILKWEIGFCFTLEEINFLAKGSLSLVPEEMVLSKSLRK